MARTPATPVYDVEAIKAAIRRRYGTMTSLARALGKNQRYISSVLLDPRHSMEGERVISAALDIPLHVLWPSRWNEDGTAKSRRVDAPIMAPLPVPTSQIGKAA